MSSPEPDLIRALSPISLAALIELFDKVLALEERQGYRNRAASGGLYAFFQQQVERLATPLPNTAVLTALLGALRQYATADVGQRQTRLPDIRASLAALTQTSPPSPRKERLSAPPAAAPSLLTPLVPALGLRTQDAGRLDKAGLRTLRDALWYLPRDHIDLGTPLTMNRLSPGLRTTVVGTLRAVTSTRLGSKGTQIVEAKVADHTAVLTARWFNQPYLAPTLKPHIGQKIAILGVVESFNGKLQLAPIDYDIIQDNASSQLTGRMIPVYPLTEGITQHWLRGVLKRACDLAAPLVEDPLPEHLRQTYQLLPLADALRHAHFPDTPDHAHTAQRRLAFDELLWISLGMLRRKQDNQATGAASYRIMARDILPDYLAALPFTLTGAQQRAIATILTDLERGTPMNRLLQGDVGAGKTAVAAAALFATARSGVQSVVMAPTEILAEQHARSLGTLLGSLGISVGLLTGSLSRADKAHLYAAAADGSLPVIVGTHALIQEGLTLKNLGLAVIDEQHRFGVEQRALLRGKGEATEGGWSPHVLIMTATPIPRTLTLTMYGDLDVSVLDERPPGRQPVETRWLPSARSAYALAREQVGLGRQVFVVCPMIEENDAVPARAAIAEHRHLQESVFADLRVGLVHGRLKAAEKDAALRRLRDHETDILVATSVIEVGIDIPNATVMIIHNANRFGLAQLHQLRGRVGRGAQRSYCLLLADEVSAVGEQRLSAITRTDDGFALAEEDLRLRGPGEFWGTRQSGLPDLQIARLSDTRTIESARQAAEAILAEDPFLTSPTYAALGAALAQFWQSSTEQS